MEINHCSWQGSGSLGCSGQSVHIIESNYVDKKGKCRASRNYKQMCLNNGNQSFRGPNRLMFQKGLISPMGERHFNTSDKPNMASRSEQVIVRENDAQENQMKKTFK